MHKAFESNILYLEIYLIQIESPLHTYICIKLFIAITLEVVKNWKPGEFPWVRHSPTWIIVGSHYGAIRELLRSLDESCTVSLIVEELTWSMSKTRYVCESMCIWLSHHGEKYTRWLTYIIWVGVGKKREVGIKKRKRNSRSKIWS